MGSRRSGQRVPVSGGAGYLGSPVVAGLREGGETQVYGDAFIEVSGSGGASRRFVYVDDAAKGIVLAAGRCADAELVNPRTGEEITIRKLGELIAVRTGFTGKSRSDTSQAGSQPRQALDTNRAREPSGLAARMLLEQGLRGTIYWNERRQGASS